MSYRDFENYLTEQMDMIKQLQVHLKTDEREDEFNHQKIKLNIYQVFQTVFKVATTKYQTPQDINAFYLEKLESIPKHWQVSYAQAIKTDNYALAFEESLKLETAKEIRNQYIHWTE